MYKKIITYTDYNDVERTETFLFNFSKAELAEIQMASGSGLESYINRIIETEDNKELVKIFKDLILKSYGIKSDDGKRFIKSDAIREEFAQTEAYSELFMELATNDKAASDFINGILPAEIQKDFQAAIAEKTKK